MISRSHFGYNEILDFVVFLKDGEVVHYEVVWRDNHTIRYPRDATYPWSLQPEEAVFNVERRSDGYRTLIIAD